jgi:hypothetical protein
MPLTKVSKFSRFNVAACMKERCLATEMLAKQYKELIAKKHKLARLDQKVGLIVKLLYYY